MDRPAGDTCTGRELADLFQRFGRGRNYWHGPIEALLVDLTVEQAAWTPAPGRHSIWQIVRHMIFWREYVLAQLRGLPPPEPATGNWSAPPAAHDAAWQQEKERYGRIHQELVAAVQSLTAEQLLSPTSWGDDGRLYHTVMGLLAHDSYHAGQIAYLRALQGLTLVD